jgi:hypothetical protein
VEQHFRRSLPVIHHSFDTLVYSDANLRLTDDQYTLVESWPQSRQGNYGIFSLRLLFRGPLILLSNGFWGCFPQDKAAEA